MSGFRQALATCRTGLIREHYLYFQLMSPTAGVVMAAVSLMAGLTPNVVTLIGIALAAPIVALNAGGQLLAACVLLHVFYAVDCADGILARATRRTSRAGAFLDDLAHLIVPPLFFLSLAYACVERGLNVLALLSSGFACLELAYRNVIQAIKSSDTGQGDASQNARLRAWAVESFHLPTASVFVTALVLWPDALTAYLAYATLAAASYFAYAAFRVSSALGSRA